MSTAKIAISMDEHILSKFDRLVKTHVYPSRSKAIQAVVQEKLEKVEQTTNTLDTGFHRGDGFL